MSPGVDFRVAQAARSATQQAMLHRQMSGVSPVLPLVAGYGANAFAQQRMPAPMPYGYPALGAVPLGPSVLADMSLTGLMPFSNVLTHNKHHVEQVPKVKKHSFLGKMAEGNLNWSDRMDRTRLVGYFNEAAQGAIHIVGEPFKLLMDKVVYGFSGLYALSKGVQAFENADDNESNKLKLSRAAAATAYGGLFQYAASCEVPVLGVKAVQWATKKIATQLGHTATAKIKNLQMISGLASIPFLVKPIDELTKFVLNHTLKPVTDAVLGIMAKTEENTRRQQQVPSAYAMASAPRFESFA